MLAEPTLSATRCGQDLLFDRLDECVLIWAHQSLHNTMNSSLRIDDNQRWDRPNTIAGSDGVVLVEDDGEI